MRRATRITGSIMAVCSAAVFFRGLYLDNLPHALAGAVLCLAAVFYTLAPDPLDRP